MLVINRDVPTLLLTEPAIKTDTAKLMWGKDCDRGDQILAVRPRELEPKAAGIVGEVPRRATR